MKLTFDIIRYGPVRSILTTAIFHTTVLAIISPYTVICNVTAYHPATGFAALVEPIADAVSSFFHSPCHEPNSRRIPDHSLQIATWPQYGNFSVHNDSTIVTTQLVEGFAYAIPRCADYDGRRKVLARLLGLTDVKVPPNEHIAVPEEWLSSAVGGAKVQVRRDGNPLINVELPKLTNRFGHFSNFSTEVIASNSTSIRPDTLWTDSAHHLQLAGCDQQWRQQPSRATTRFYPARGLTVVSDVDDILRLAEVWNPKQTLLNTFVRPFRPWMDMPAVFQRWQRAAPDAHFHWITDLPEVGSRFYVEGLSR